jgi:hypothetical protein
LPDAIAEWEAALFGSWAGRRDKPQYKLDDHALSFHGVSTHPFIKVVLSDYHIMEHCERSRLEISKEDDIPKFDDSLRAKVFAHLAAHSLTVQDLAS